jgi:flagellar biosynthesis/type III secretory pathway protein FliH
LFSNLKQEAAENAAHTWKPLSASSYSCFSELEDDFDGMKNSSKNQTAFAENSARHKAALEQFEQDMLQNKQIELINFTARLNEIQEKYVNEIRVHEQVLAEQVLALAIRLAEKVVRTHFDVDKSALLPLVEEALAQILPGDDNIKLHVHPDDVELISQTFNDGVTAGLTAGRLTFVADAGLLLGSCRIQSDYSVVDNSLMVRWEQMLRETGLSKNYQPLPNFCQSKMNESENI